MIGYLPRFFGKALKRSSWLRLLRLRRSWGMIRNSDDPEQVMRHANALASSPLARSDLMVRMAGVPERHLGNFHTCLRQLLQAQMYSQIQPEILLGINGYASAPPVPAEWQQFLSARQVRLNRFRAEWAYRVLAARGLARGASYALAVARQFLRSRDEAKLNQPHALFIGCPPAFVPRNAEGWTSRYSILAWSKEFLAADVLRVQTSKADATAPDGFELAILPLRPLTDARAVAAFLSVSIRILLVGAVDLLLGKAYVAVGARDILELRHAKALDQSRLPAAIVGENSRWFHRPLFTYFVRQSVGAPSMLAFYATNMDLSPTFWPAKSDPVPVPGYETMSWDRYLVWDDYHGKLIESWGHDPDAIDVVGPIPMNSSPAPSQHDLSHSIAVFDVSPHRPSALAAIGLIPKYYDDEIVAQFLDDIREVATGVRVDFVLKRKRTTGSRMPNRYAAALQRIEASPIGHEVHPDISAEAVAANAMATIAFPFSSPAILAAMQGRPAVFYDPTGLLQATDRQSHGLTVLRGRKDLSEWLENVIGLGAKQGVGAKDPS